MPMPRLPSFAPILAAFALGGALAQRQPLPLVQPVHPDVPGAVQPRAPGQRPAAPLPQITLNPMLPEVKKIEYASNGFIEVAHALILVPKSENDHADELAFAQAAVSRAFMARPGLDEVDFSAYLASSYEGPGGPLPRLTGSVPRARFGEFLSITPRTLGHFERLWVNPSGVAKSPKRRPSTDLEVAPVFDGSAEELRAQQVRQLASQSVGGPRGGLLFHGDPTRSRIALTFDDAPHPLFEPLLLDTLRRAGIKATFFVVGRNAKPYPYFVSDMVRDGHEVANHTEHHVRLNALSESEVRAELLGAQRVLKDITGLEARYFRPPGGRYSPLTLRIASSLGLTTVFWTDDPGDFDNLGEVLLESRLEKRLRPGGIVLMHDNVLESIQVLAEFLRDARERGYALGTVTNLIEGG